MHRKRARRVPRGVWLATSRSHSLDDLHDHARFAGNDVVEQPRWIKQLALALGAGAYAGIPVWKGAQHWSRIAVPVAYALWYKQIRPMMPSNGVSQRALVKVADARAGFADGVTGQHCRPKVSTLARITGLDERTVQRASLALRLLGCATEVMRGRLRTKQERLASWAMGDRSRGWASVWALHVPRPAVDNSRDERGLWKPVFLELSPHPRRGSISVEKVPFRRNSPTGSCPQPSPTDAEAGWRPPMNGGASRPAQKRQSSQGRRNAGVDEAGRLLAARWLADGQTPAWAGRHTPRGWARVLAGPAAHGWTPADLNMALHEWVHVGGNWCPATPYKPIGLLATVIAWHGDLADPPAAAERAREAAERAAERAALASERAANAAKDVVKASPAHRAAARQAFAEAERVRRRGRPVE